MDAFCYLFFVTSHWRDADAAVGSHWSCPADLGCGLVADVRGRPASSFMIAGKMTTSGIMHDYAIHTRTWTYMIVK